MPGFGGGPLGGDPAGQFNWTRKVLYELAPEIYRTADLEQEEFFRRYAEAQGASFDLLRAKIGAFADLRDPRRVRTQYDKITTLRLGPVEVRKGPVEQRGLRGTVTALREFSTGRGRFSTQDIGKELTVSRSAIADNNRTVLITNIVSSSVVLTNPQLFTDAGPLRWELRELEESEVRETLVEVYDGDVSSIAPGWILSDGFADFTVTERRQFKPASAEKKLLTLREGLDGLITTALRFTSPTIALTSRDVGRRLSIAGAENSDNNGRFGIVDVLSSTECILDSLDLVPELTGELVWALYRTAELTLEGTSTLKGAVEQQGEDGDITASGPPSVFESASANFQTEDEGKLLTLHSPSNVDNATYEVLAVNSASELELDGTIGVTTGFHWELRDATDVGDETQVTVRAPSLIRFLAQDFGVEIDDRDEEEWQRRWVESVSRWIGLKGHPDVYEFLAALTGFTAQAFGLYRVNQETFLAVEAAGGAVHKAADGDEGRSGVDGSLNVVSGNVRFSSPSAAFVGTDVGRVIEVFGSGGGGANDGLRTIAEVIDANTVRFRGVDAMTGSSDPNNGALEWLILALYTEQAPTLPVHDEINSDRMSYLKTTAVFTVDKYCWEQNPSPWSTLLGPGNAGDGRIFVTAVTPSGSAPFPTVYTVTGRGDFDVAVGLGVGFWRLTDSSAVEFILESVPTLGPIEQGGSNGLLTLSGPSRFTSASATFTAADEGKRLVITGSGSSNNRTFIIDTFIDANNVDLDTTDTPTTPDANNGSLGWSVRSLIFTVEATSPPAVGAASLDYLCAENTTCNYCRARQVLVEASTPYLLEAGFERLRGRLAQGKPAHVEIIESFGLELSASLSLTATVDSP